MSTGETGKDNVSMGETGKDNVSMGETGSGPMSAVEIAAAVRDGSMSAASVVERHLGVIAERDEEIHAFNTVVADRALEAAGAIDEAVAAGRDVGPLAGVPVALKDNMCTRGVPTTCSSKILEDWKPPYNGTVVERLAAAGAVMVGKTNLDEFAMGSSTENSAFGPTRNPVDPTRVPGGSSGGSAAAVAAGFAPLSFGSDTGGSIRQPAALCGVVGVKPTYGAVSRYGLVAFASSLDQIGPFSRTVAESALALDVIAGHDPRDSTSIDRDFQTVTPHLDEGVDGLRVGVIAELTGQNLDGFEPEVVERARLAADALSAAGAKVEEVSIPSTIAGLSAYYMIAPAEASSNLGSLRRCSIRDAAAGTEHGVDDGRVANRRLRRGGQASDHARHLRPLRRLLRCLLRKGPAGQDGDDPRVR